MRTLRIRNVLAHDDLAVVFGEGITLVNGHHSAGKTSMARALAAVVAHEPNPAGLSAAEAKAYLRGSAVEGTVELSDGATWVLPKQMVVPEGVTPEARPHHVGIVRFAETQSRAKDQRAAIYENLFLPPDAEALLRPVWKAPERQLAAALKEIERTGWPAAAKIYDGIKASHRRRWEEITGDHFGTRKAPQWRPEAWEPDLEGLSEENIVSACAEADDALRAAGVSQAIEQDQIDRARDIRDKQIPEHEQKLAALEKEIDERKPPFEAARKAHMAAKKIEYSKRQSRDAAGAALAAVVANRNIPPEPMRCPSCKVPLATVRGGLEIIPEPEIPDAAETEKVIAASRRNLATAEAEFHAAETDCIKALAEGRKLRDGYESAIAAAERMRGVIEHLKGQTSLADAEPSPGNEALRSRLVNNRDAAARRRRAWETNRDAQREYQSYVEAERIAKLLGPSGVRAQAMQAAMDRVRKALASICTIAEWAPITVTADYTITSGGRPCVLTAANEQAKVQWALQIALVMLDPNARWLVIDATDQLRGASWDGLTYLLERLRAKRPALHIVVCDTEKRAPDGWSVIEI